MTATLRMLAPLGALLAAFACACSATAIEPAAKPEGTFGRQLRMLEQPLLAPDYVFREAGGREWGFIEFRGRVVVATIWATWCGVCRKELPKLDAVEAALRGHGITVVALAQDVDAEQVEKTFDERGLRHLRAFQDVDSVLTASFGVRGVPTSFVIRPDGHVIGVVQGPAAWDSKEAHDFLRSLSTTPPSTIPDDAPGAVP